MPIEPGDKVEGISRRIRVEFQRVVAVGVFDDLPVWRSESFEVLEGPGVVDDPIPAGDYYALARLSRYAADVDQRIQAGRLESSAGPAARRP